MGVAAGRGGSGVSLPFSRLSSLKTSLNSPTSFCCSSTPPAVPPIDPRSFVGLLSSDSRPRCKASLASRIRRIRSSRESFDPSGPYIREEEGGPATASKTFSSAAASVVGGRSERERVASRRAWRVARVSSAEGGWPDESSVA